MPVYNYKALDASAKATTGVIDAETPRDAREKLRGRKVYVTELSIAGVSEAQAPAKRESTRPNRRGAAPPSNGLKFKLPKIDPGAGKRNSEVGQFTRQLSTMLKAGIPLTQGLSALVEQTESRTMQTVIRDIREQVSTGTGFGDALAKHPRYFSNLYRSMVRAGEASGELDAVLYRVADFMQKQIRLRNKVVTALTYPAVMLFIALGVVIFLMNFVVPDILKLLKEQRIPMPLPTQIVATGSDILTGYWYVVLGVFIVGAGLFGAWKGSEKGAYTFDRFMLRAPVFGQLFTKTAVSRFSTTFAVLLKSGLPALEGLRIVKEVVGNMALSKVIGEVHDSIIEGTDIATPIKKSGFFPPVVGYMISVGEQTGELETLLDRISEAYDEEVDLAVQRMTSMIEPIMIVFMATTVGTIIAAVMLPLMQMSAGGGIR